MENIFPNISKSIFLEKQLRNKLESSLFHLIGLGEDIFHAEKYQLLVKKIKALVSKNNLSGLIYSLNNELIEAAINEDKKRFIFLCDQLLAYDFTSQSFNFQHVESICQNAFYKDLLIKATVHGDKQNQIFETEVMLNNKSTFEHSKKITLEALDLMEKELPDFYGESKIFIKELLFFKSKDLKHGTSFDLLGLIYIREKEESCTRIDMIDCLVHETAHLYLYVLSSFDEIVLNDYDETFKSPFREYERPMMGIYHAVFVIARLIMAFDVIKKKAVGLSVDEIAQITAYLEKYKKLFQASFPTIKEHGKLTEVGKKLIYSANDVVKLSMAA